MHSPLREGSDRATSSTGWGEIDTVVDPIDAMLDEHHPIVEAASAWAREHLEPLGPGIDRTRWRLLAEAGFQSIVTPASDGGLGRSTVEAMLAYEGLGHGCTDNGLVFALSSQVFATQNALRSAASPEQLTLHLPGLLSGETFGAFAMSEPDAGSDTGAIRTTAKRIDGHADDADHPDAVYEVSGEKCWITLGPMADVIVLFATTDPALGRWGITAFVVEADRAGVERGPDVRKLGLHSSPFGSLHFDRGRLTAADRLGPEGGGGGVFSKAVEGERAFLFAGQLGSTRRVIEQAIQRARTPGADRRTPGADQSVSHRIADMKLDHEMARLLVYKAAILADRRRSVGMASALAKLHTSEMAVATASDALNIHGTPALAGHGTADLDLHDALGGLAYSGTSDIQRMIVARLLRVDAPLRPKPVHPRSAPDTKTPDEAARPEIPAGDTR